MMMTMMKMMVKFKVHHADLDNCDDCDYDNDDDDDNDDNECDDEV